MNKPEECQRFETCGAPLCPLDQESLENGIFYASEEVCTRQGLKLLWLRNQRKIARKTKDPDIGFFTINMIDRRIKISKAIKGIDPDRPDEEKLLLNRWFRLHPDRPKKVLTKEQLEKMQRGLQAYKANKGGTGAVKIGQYTKESVPK